MKLTLLTAFSVLQLLKWSSLAHAETILTSIIDQPVSYEYNPANFLPPETEIGVEKASFTADERSLTVVALNNDDCRIETQWEDTIVLELKFNSSICFKHIVDNAILAGGNNPDVARFVREVETSFRTTYRPQRAEVAWG